MSLSFHYIQRLKDRGTDKETVQPITAKEFDDIYKMLVASKSLDMSDDDTFVSVAHKNVAPITRLERVDSRTICGKYESSYYGHAYKNTFRGDIPANSVNLRPFFFYLYLSKEGQVYISSQYLGNFGGYTQIKNTIIKALQNRSEIDAVSFNVADFDLKNADIKEIEIQFSRNASSIAQANKFGRMGAIVLSVPDDKVVRDGLIQHYPFKSDKKLRTAIATLANQSELLEIKDEDIRSAKLLVRSGKKNRNIYLIAGVNYATRFAVDVPKDADGHPQYEPLKTKAKALLTNEILSKK